MKKFWNLQQPSQDEPAELLLEGAISEESWWEDDVTPAAFRADLAKYAGRDIVVKINSPGGDVFAASVIYTALMEHKGSVTVVIEGLAASAASVVAMAGEKVLMAPTAYLMIHNPWTVAMGNSEDMRHEADVLDEIAEGLVLAYSIKSGLSKAKIRQMMADETWMSASTAIDLGFADGLVTRGEKPEDPEEEPDEDEDDKPAEQDPEEEEEDEEKKPADHRAMYRRAAACSDLMRRIAASCRTKAPAPEAATQQQRDAFLAKMRAAAEKNQID